MSTISAGTTSTTALVNTGDTTGNLVFQTNGTTTAMTIDTSQNVGIGTTSPVNLLTVQTAATGTTAGSNVIARLQSNASGRDATLQLSDNVANSVTVSMVSGATVFRQNGVESMRIDSSGNLLVGTTSQSGKLAVNGVATSASLVTFYSSTAGDVGQAGLLIGKQDNNTTTSQVILRATILSTGAGQGQINANGANALAFGTYSDSRLKENITDLPSQLANIMALRPVEFDYIESEGGGHQIGFIAQEMQQVYPDAVGEREDGMLTVSGWSKTEARLVKAIQEQQAMITQLQAEVAALKGAQ